MARPKSRTVPKVPATQEIAMKYDCVGTWRISTEFQYTRNRCSRQKNTGPVNWTGESGLIRPVYVYSSFFSFIRMKYLAFQSDDAESRRLDESEKQSDRNRTAVKTFRECSKMRPLRIHSVKRIGQ
ncbi:uncharacterized protein CLUP02_17548 [Colletotrichum lupini]|uniref:Uncharacterized protein n=1 Tax=Colletotrichum lupini TaxID=145971 RepID=A0A9Q8SGF6_9PEZI|nr:uncharacterized protein CLUP02_17548 [Colletotrichum lupini]UQC76037.1 hypothetical protein CLUP02_17548 [Colletotrichum lupini]